MKITNSPSDSELIHFFCSISDLTESQVYFLISSNPNYWREVFERIASGYLALKDAKNICKRMEIV